MAKLLTYQKARELAARMLENRSWKDCVDTALWKKLREDEYWKFRPDTELYEINWKIRIVEERFTEEIENYGNRKDKLMLCAGMFAEAYYINEDEEYGRSDESQEQMDKIELMIVTVSGWNQDWLVKRCYEIMEQNESAESVLIPQTKTDDGSLGLLSPVDWVEKNYNYKWHFNQAFPLVFVMETPFTSYDQPTQEAVIEYYTAIACKIFCVYVRKIDRRLRPATTPQERAAIREALKVEYSQMSDRSSQSPTIYTAIVEASGSRPTSSYVFVWDSITRTFIGQDDMMGLPDDAIIIKMDHETVFQYSMEMIVESELSHLCDDDGFADYVDYDFPKWQHERSKISMSADPLKQPADDESSSQPGQPAKVSTPKLSTVDTPIQKEPYIDDAGKWHGRAVALANFLWYHHTACNPFGTKRTLIRRAALKHGFGFENLNRRFRGTPSEKGRENKFPSELNERALLLFSYLSKSE